MDNSRTNDQSASGLNPTQNFPSNGVFSAPAHESTPAAPADSGSTNGGPRVPSSHFPPLQPKAQIARSGGIGLATTVGATQAAAIQEKLRNAAQQAAAAPHRPLGSYEYAPSNHVQALAPPQQGPAWDVPNPLIGGAPGSRSVTSQHAALQTQLQPRPSNNSVPPSSSATIQHRVIMPQHMSTQPQHHQQQLPSAQPRAHQALQSQPQGPHRKPKVVLSPEAKAALAKAIWSAIRSPEGAIAPDLMQAALATGLPKNAILNAARVAREREAQKRMAMQEPQPPAGSASIVAHQTQAQYQQMSNHSTSSQMLRPHNSLPGTRPAPIATSLPVPVPKPNISRPPTKPTVLVAAKSVTPTNASKVLAAPKAKPTQTIQQLHASKLLQIRSDERAKWKRVHQGIFLLQKGKFLAPPHTISAILRCATTNPVLVPSPMKTLPAMGKKVRRDVLLQAAGIQKMLQVENRPPVTQLLEPDKFKRIKIEAKKHAKALERVVRRARQTSVEALNKQHKELSKSLASHQQDFFKFHKQRRADAQKVAKLIRDNFDKESKKKEKDAVAAERARLAALKANDMDAYSKLLEETKNERLKFLMDKTEKHFSQISTSLLQHRNKDGSVASTGGTASYYASAHLKTEEVRQPSILVGGDLKEYQMSGLQWLVSLYNNKLNGILADEMGLGKTIQAISLVAYLMELKGNLGPYLVIVPLSTLSNWVNEFHKWCPSAHVICYKGTPGQRKEIYRDQVKNGHFNVLLTTYEYIIKDKASLRKITWQYAIVDEGHRMKNAASKFAKTLATQYTTKFRLLLTGTPLMNDLSELWSLLNFLLPSIFNSVDTFDQWFNRPFAQFGNTTNDDENNNLTNEERMFIIHRLHELLRPFMLRRVKSEVLDQLPEKVEKVLRCELSSWQKELYKQISKKAVVENGLLGTSFVQPQPASRGLNNVVMQLRKVCNHPYLFAPQGYQINENIIRSSGKLELLDRMLPKLRAAGHRVLMFTQMTALMTILEDYFAYRGYLSLRLDGSTPAEEREKRMYKFNSPDSPYFIFLLSTRAGGLGLNLTSANTVIIVDSDWNPMMDLQAQDRAHRIGQRSDVSVFRLVTYSPVEEKILSRATEKLNMSELVVEAGQFDKRSVENDNSLERKRMMEVLLTDFDTNTAKSTMEEKATSEMTGSDAGDDENDDDDDDSEESKEEDLNDLLSGNENDYQLYKSIDKERESNPAVVDTSLFTSEDDIPDWVKYPSGRKNAAAIQDGAVPGSGSRKRKEVMYDDGLTEKQFLRLMDKQHDADAAAREQAKQANKRGESTIVPAYAEESFAAVPGSELTDWTFRKLISCTKAVIALKDPSTKRRLSEIFLEKPSPEQFPDYYELIPKPIAINDILRKCRAKLYVSMQEYREDWKLMFANARTFNGDESWVVKDGLALEKELERLLKKNGFGEEAPKKPPAPKPKKKLRIKLSLKTLKAVEAPAPDANLEATDPEPGVGEDAMEESSTKGRKKKRKLK